MNYHGPVKGYPENDHLDQSAAYVGDQRDHATLGGQEQPAPSIEILMVAEKPSIARAIADCLTGEKYLTRRGESKYCPVFEYIGPFFGQLAKFKITSVTGHVYCRDFPPRFADWYQCDPIELFDAPTLKREANPDNNLINHLKKEAEGCSNLVLWLDNDKEGENICFEIVDIALPQMIKMTTRQVFRVKFSSITREDILHAFDSMTEGPNKNESLSVDARQIIDLKVGVAFSRFQSLYLKKKFQNLNQKMITFGPCQTPTLNFCVERHQEILNFRPTTYYKIDCKLRYKDSETLNLLWEKESVSVHEEVKDVEQQVKGARIFHIQSVVSKENFRNKPEGMNTIQLLKHSSSMLGLGPNDAMNVAEKLYLGGFITYPRTETTFYNPNFDFHSLLNSISKSSNPLAEYADQLLQFGFSASKSGVDAGDHPPIMPTHKVPAKGFLSGQEFKLYDYICRTFLASLSRDACFVKTKIIFEAAGHQFSLNGTTVVDSGFTEITPWVKMSNKAIPNLEKGQEFPLSEISVVELQTSAPNYLSESELMSLMEKNGIGTDASMATHINNICQRNFVEVITRARRLKPTPLGNALIQGYKEIDTELISAELRSNIEKNMDLIAQGKKDIDSVLSTVLSIFKQKYEYFRQNISKLEMTFVQVYGTFMDSLKKGIPFSLCGRCSQKMLLVEDFNKTYCKNCKITLNLPRDAKYSLESTQSCPLDGYQIINYYILREGYETHLKCCPQCYHKSPHPEISQRLICSQCPHESCFVSVRNTSVCVCPKCRRGLLVINRPIDRSYYVTCNHNRCSHMLVVVQSAIEVRRSKAKCPNCSSFKLMVYTVNVVDFVETCVFCDDRFAPYIYEPRPTKKQIQENMDTYNRPATKSADPGLSKHHHQRRKSQGDFGRRANNYQKRGQDVSSSHHGKADPYHKKESKRKVNQGVKNGKWSKDKGTDGDGHKQASHPSFTKPQPLALEGDKSSTAYDGLMRRLDNKERDNKLGHSGESNGILADRARNGSRFVSFSRFDIEDETNIDNQRVKMGSNNIKDKHVAVNFQQPQAENEDSASEKIRLQRENASLMGSRGQFSSNY